MWIFVMSLRASEHFYHLISGSSDQKRTDNIKARGLTGCYLGFVRPSNFGPESPPSLAPTLFRRAGVWQPLEPLVCNVSLDFFCSWQILDVQNAFPS